MFEEEWAGSVMNVVLVFLAETGRVVSYLSGLSPLTVTVLTAEKCLQIIFKSWKSVHIVLFSHCLQPYKNY